jgi:hypothetical protein
MKLKVTLLTCLCLLFTIDVVQAQDSHPIVEAFGGFSYVRTAGEFAAPFTGDRNLYGWNGAVSVNPDRIFGFTADVSGHYQDFIFGNTDTLTILAGPRFTARNEYATTFMHVLFGRTRSRSEVRTLDMNFDTEEKSFAVAIGGGIDVNVTEHFGFRILQVEYALTRFNSGIRSNQHNLRAGIGFVFRGWKKGD